MAANALKSRRSNSDRQRAALSRSFCPRLSFDGRECTYRGFLSESAVGAMTCTGNLSLPVKLWAK
jgi:hypothetical protein